MAASRCSTRPSPSTARRRPKPRAGRHDDGASFAQRQGPLMSEDLEFAFALVLSGASIGLMYSLIALGFVLVYKATDAINFAQGEFVMLAGLIVAVVLGFEGAPLIAAVVVVLAVSIAFRVGPEWAVLAPFL